MGNTKIGDSIKQEKFLDVLKRYISALIQNNRTVPIMVWDYNFSVELFEETEFKIQHLDMDFLTMRKLQIGNLDIDADIIIINDFCSITKTVQSKIIYNIEEKKFNSIFVFTDQKINSGKLSLDILDSMTHFVVIANEQKL